MVFLLRFEQGGIPLFCLEGRLALVSMVGWLLRPQSWVQIPRCSAKSVQVFSGSLMHKAS